MMWCTWPFALWLPFFSAGFATAPETPLAVDVTYVANEGFLLSAGVDKVLIDALHSGGIEKYASPSASLREQLQRASGAFESVSLVLVSHSHVDHFDPRLTAAHIRNNPGVRFISTSQMLAPVLRQLDGGEGFIDQLEAAPYLANGERSIHRVGGIRAQLFRLDHGGYPAPRYQLHNLGHLVTLGGVTFLHVGDADPTSRNYGRHRLTQESIDVAFLPYWYLLNPESRRVISEHIRPKQIVPVHIPPSELQQQKEAIRKWFPQAVFFEGPMITKQFRPVVPDSVRP